MAETTAERKRHPRLRALLLWGGALLLALAVVLLLVLGDDGNGEPVTTVPATGDPSVHLGLDVEILADTLVLRGETDLPDGSYLSYEAQQVEDAQMRWHAEGHVQVRYGFFDERIDIGEWPDGDIEVYLAYPSTIGGVEQPAETVERYGERGERLEGPGVTEYEDGRRIEKFAVVQYREEES